jgi:hypothetical protein
MLHRLPSHLNCHTLDRRQAEASYVFWFGFVFSDVANVCISMISYDLCLLLAQFRYSIIIILYLKSIKIILKYSVRTSQETHYVSATKPTYLLPFWIKSLSTVRTIRNEQIRSVSIMQSSYMLTQVVHIVFNGLSWININFSVGVWFVV